MECRYHYELLGRITGLDVSEGKSLSWEYSGVRELIREMDEKVNTISYTYAKLHRLLSVINLEGAKTSIHKEYRINKQSEEQGKFETEFKQGC